jgi:hypothetical protein
VWLNFTASPEFFCSYNRHFSNVTSFAQTLSVFCSLQGYVQDHPVILEVWQRALHLLETGKSVVFCWVPDHTCLPGYTVTDTGTRESAVFRNLTSGSALGSGVCAFGFLALCHHGMTNPDCGQQIMHDDTIHAYMAFLLRLHQDWGGYDYVALVWSFLTHVHLLRGDLAPLF